MNIHLTRNSQALRIGRLHETGRPFLITTSTRNRIPIFARSTYSRTAATILNDQATCPSASILLWVLMPDHLHLLLVPNSEETLSRAVGRIKAAISRCLPGTCGSPWQVSFHDHALREEEDIGSVGRYLLLNPVRAGLVRDPSQWPWRGGQLLEAMMQELPGQVPEF